MEGRRKKQVWAEEKVKVQCSLTAVSADPMGSSEVRVALQSCPELGPLGWPGLCTSVHQSLGMGCPGRGMVSG